MRFLILGGSRFVGPALIKLLLSRNNSVTVLNRGTRSIPGTQQLVADRNNADAMAKIGASCEPFDVVIDLSCYNRSQAQLAWSAFALHAKRWIHLSSIAVYAELSPIPSEQSAIGSTAVWGEYWINKSDADAFLLAQSGVPITILRPPYLYGPGNHIDRETFVWKRVLRGIPVLIPGDGTAAVQFLHVEDLAQAILAAAEAPSSDTAVYNVAADTGVTLQEYVRKLAGICHADDTGIAVRSADAGFAAREYFPFGDHPCCMDFSLIGRALHWKPRYTFEKGFAQTYATYDPSMLQECALDLTVEHQILERLRQS